LSPAVTHPQITWTFFAPACPRPVGGDIARFELVNALAKHGDRVRVVHLPTSEIRIRNLGDLPWFAFDDHVEHEFCLDLDPARIADSDVVVYSTNLLATALSLDAGAHGRELIAQLQVDRTRRWEPILLLQGFGVFPPAAEDLAFRLPGPKVCVGSWLASRVRSSGVSADDVVHIPNGVDPGTFRISTPIEGRAPHAAMNFDPHPAKAGYVGLDALTRFHAAAGVPSTVFGTITPMPPVGAGLRFVASPSQPVIARSIYNEASLFLQPSVREGFGMCAVESMACGCALVTTDNGGSQDYAFDGETALVCGNEPADMADSLARLAADEALRLRIATNGSRFVDRFRWTASAGRLRELAGGLLGAPARSREGPPAQVPTALGEYERPK